MSVALDGPDGTTMVAEQRGLQKDTALHAKIAVSGMDFFWSFRVFVPFSGPNLRKCMNVGLERAGAKMAAAEATRVAEDREPHAKIQVFVISHDFSLQIAISRWILRFRRNQRQEGLVLPYEIMEKCSRACGLIISS